MNMGQVMFIRGAFATLFVRRSPGIRARSPICASRCSRWCCCASLGEALATVTFLIALAQLPIANVSAVLQALPLAVTMGAALIYGETVGWRRWLSIARGLCRRHHHRQARARKASTSIRWWRWSASASAPCATLPPGAFPHEIPTLLISTVTALAVTVCGAFLIQPMGGWTPPGAFDLFLLACAAGLLLVGYQFIILAMRSGEISFVAPFRYTGLLLSILLGFVVFGDVPDLAMILGSAIIVGSGLYMLYRERVVGRSKAAAESVGPSMAPDGL